MSTSRVKLIIKAGTSAQDREVILFFNPADLSQNKDAQEAYLIRCAYFITQQKDLANIKEFYLSERNGIPYVIYKGQEKNDLLATPLELNSAISNDILSDQLNFRQMGGRISVEQNIDSPGLTSAYFQFKLHQIISILNATIIATFKRYYANITKQTVSQDEIINDLETLKIKKESLNFLTEDLILCEMVRTASAIDVKFPAHLELYSLQQLKLVIKTLLAQTNGVLKDALVTELKLLAKDYKDFFSFNLESNASESGFMSSLLSTFTDKTNYEFKFTPMMHDFENKASGKSSKAIIVSPIEELKPVPEEHVTAIKISKTKRGRGSPNKNSSTSISSSHATESPAIQSNSKNTPSPKRSPKKNSPEKTSPTVVFPSLTEVMESEQNSNSFSSGEYYRSNSSNSKKNEIAASILNPSIAKSNEENLERHAELDLAIQLAGAKAKTMLLELSGNLLQTLNPKGNKEDLAEELLSQFLTAFRDDIDKYVKGLKNHDRFYSLNPKNIWDNKSGLTDKNLLATIKQKQEILQYCFDNQNYVAEYLTLTKEKKQSLVNIHELKEQPVPPLNITYETIANDIKNDPQHNNLKKEIVELGYQELKLLLADFDYQLLPASFPKNANKIYIGKKSSGLIYEMVDSANQSHSGTIPWDQLSPKFQNMDFDEPDIIANKNNLLGEIYPLIIKNNNIHVKTFYKINEVEEKCYADIFKPSTAPTASTQQLVLDTNIANLTKEMYLNSQYPKLKNQIIHFNQSCDALLNDGTLKELFLLQAKIVKLLMDAKNKIELSIKPTEKDSAEADVEEINNAHNNNPLSANSNFDSKKEKIDEVTKKIKEEHDVEARKYINEINLLIPKVNSFFFDQLSVDTVKDEKIIQKNMQDLLKQAEKNINYASYEKIILEKTLEANIEIIEGNLDTIPELKEIPNLPDAFRFYPGPDDKSIFEISTKIAVIENTISQLKPAYAKTKKELLESKEPIPNIEDILDSKCQLIKAEINLLLDANFARKINLSKNDKKPQTIIPANTQKEELEPEEDLAPPSSTASTSSTSEAIHIARNTTETQKSHIPSHLKRSPSRKNGKEKQPTASDGLMFDMDMDTDVAQQSSSSSATSASSIRPVSPPKKMSAAAKTSSATAAILSTSIQKTPALIESKQALDDEPKESLYSKARNQLERSKDLIKKYDKLTKEYEAAVTKTTELNTQRRKIFNDFQAFYTEKLASYNQRLTDFQKVKLNETIQPQPKEKSFQDALQAKNRAQNALNSFKNSLDKMQAILTVLQQHVYLPPETLKQNEADLSSLQIEATNSSLGLTSVFSAITLINEANEKIQVRNECLKELETIKNALLAFKKGNLPSPEKIPVSNNLLSDNHDIKKLTNNELLSCRNEITEIIKQIDTYSLQIRQSAMGGQFERDISTIRSYRDTIKTQFTKTDGQVKGIYADYLKHITVQNEAENTLTNKIIQLQLTDLALDHRYETLFDSKASAPDWSIAKKPYEVCQKKYTEIQSLHRQLDIDIQELKTDIQRYYATPLEKSAIVNKLTQTDAQINVNAFQERLDSIKKRQKELDESVKQFKRLPALQFFEFADFPNIAGYITEESDNLIEICNQVAAYIETNTVNNYISGFPQLNGYPLRKPADKSLEGPLLEKCNQYLSAVYEKAAKEEPTTPEHDICINSIKTRLNPQNQKAIRYPETKLDLKFPAVTPRKERAVDKFFGYMVGIPLLLLGAIAIGFGVGLVATGVFSPAGIALIVLGGTGFVSGAGMIGYNAHENHVVDKARKPLVNVNARRHSDSDSGSNSDPENNVKLKPSVSEPITIHHAKPVDHLNVAPGSPSLFHSAPHKKPSGSPETPNKSSGLSRTVPEKKHHH